MLKLRVPYIRGETATSFCSRLALRNRCRSIAEFGLDVGLVFRDVVAGTQEGLARLSALGGVDLAHLTSSAFRGNGTRFTCGNNILEQTLRRPMSRLMVCPACIAGDLATHPDIGSAAPAGRVAWLLEPISTCIEHDLALVVADVQPQNSVRGAGYLLDFSRRAQPFIQRIENHQASALRRPPSGLERYLCARLDGPFPVVSDLVDSLPFYAVAQASLILGAFITFGPKLTLRKLTDEQRRDAGEAGFCILAAGAVALEEFLRTSMDRWPRSKNATSMNAFFGALSQWLGYRSDDASYEFLRSTIRNLMFSSQPLRENTTIYGVSLGAERIKSVLTLSEEMGVHPNRLQRLLVATGVLDESSARLSAHKAVFVVDEKASDIVARLSRCMSKTAAAKYVNAPWVHFDTLHRAGLIMPFVEPIGILSVHGFDRLDLDHFLERLLYFVRGPAPENILAIPISSAATRLNCSALQIVQLIFGGKLTEIYRRQDVGGFLGILVNPEEVRVALRRPERPGLSIEQVGERMRWSRPVIDALIAHGWLAAEIVRHPIIRRQQKVIEPRDLEEFDRIYVALSALGRELRLSLPAIKALLTDGGIESAFDPEVIGATFYRRADLPWSEPARTRRN
ncbi:MAG: hypothetical protein VR70_16990 [Rhodospirillaceae bacterium BRH_c57]|nr:MAG: hypothetical protein VR70_16990 [Rhodospirillaceae bacterium BRH_c57]